MTFLEEQRAVDLRNLKLHTSVLKERVKFLEEQLAATTEAHIKAINEIARLQAKADVRIEHEGS